MSLYGFLGPTLRRQLPGRVVSARTINGAAITAENVARRRVGPGMASIDVAGIPNEWATFQTTQWARLIASSGSGGAYTWQGIFEVPGSPGTWADLPSRVSDNTGADLAYEANGNTSLVAGTRVPLLRETYSGAYTFYYGSC